MNAHTRISAKGQVVIPKTVRDARHWLPGTDLEVIERPDGVLLRVMETRAKVPFEEALRRIRDIYRHSGPPFTDADFDAARDQALEETWGDRLR